MAQKRRDVRTRADRAECSTQSVAGDSELVLTVAAGLDGCRVNLGPGRATTRPTSRRLHSPNDLSAARPGPAWVAPSGTSGTDGGRRSVGTRAARLKGRDWWGSSHKRHVRGGRESTTFYKRGEKQ